MKVVTVASDSQRYFPYLVESCNRNSCQLVVLGWGEKWKGFSWKIELMKEFLSTQSDEEILCFVDAYDVILLQHHDTILNNFKKAVGARNDLVLVSEDRSTKTSTTFSVFNKLFFKMCGGAYINSGTYMGHVKALRTMLSYVSNMMANVAENDQRLMQIVCQKKPELFLIDRDCSVFLVICSPGEMISRRDERIEVINGEIIYDKNTRPCILHASGYTNIDDVLYEFGYGNALYTFDTKESKKYVRNSIRHYGWWFIKYNSPVIMIILLICGLVLWYFLFSQNRFLKR